MTKIINSVQNKTMQYLIFLAISLVLTGFSAILYLSDGRIFQQYFGRLNPPMVIGLVTFLGMIFISFLLGKGFSIYQKGNWVGFFLAAGLAILFGLVIIVIDMNAPFAEDINTPFPGSLLFYPTMGFVVEVLFHAGLLTLLLLLLQPFFTITVEHKIIWVCLLLVSVVEPIYQTALGAERPYLIWPDLVVALHIFLINLCGLALFKRFDFITMYSFRLVYYLIWHVGWGHLRLSLLF